MGLVTIKHDRVGTQSRSGDTERDSAASLGQFFDDKDQLHRAAAQAAVLLGDIDAEKIRFTKFFDNLPRIFLGLVVMLADLLILVCAIDPRGLDDHLLLFCQFVIHKNVRPLKRCL